MSSSNKILSLPKIVFFPLIAVIAVVISLFVFFVIGGASKSNNSKKQTENKKTLSFNSKVVENTGEDTSKEILTEKSSVDNPSKSIQPVVNVSNKSEDKSTKTLTKKVESVGDIEIIIEESADDKDDKLNKENAPVVNTEGIDNGKKVETDSETSVIEIVKTEDSENKKSTNVSENKNKGITKVEETKPTTIKSKTETEKPEEKELKKVESTKVSNKEETKVASTKPDADKKERIGKDKSGNIPSQNYIDRNKELPRAGTPEGEQYKKGQDSFNSQKYELAIANFNRAIEIADDFNEAYYQLAMCYTKMKLYSKAIQVYNLIVKKFPNQVEAYQRLGALYHTIGDYDSAIDNFNSALKIDPDNSISHLGLSMVYKAKGKNELAIREQQIAQELMGKK